MTRPQNEKMRKAKVKRILDAAQSIFKKKGFLAVTMQDIVDECSISRGGVYLYYSSVDEIFMEVIKRRNKERFSAISKMVHDTEPFEEVLEIYLTKQKNRLLNFDSSLFRAYCEYVFSKPKPAARAFSDVQLGHLRKTINSILTLGANQGKINKKQIASLTDHFIVIIDGLGIMALADAISEEIIDAQFKLLKSLLLISP